MRVWYALHPVNWCICVVWMSACLVSLDVGVYVCAKCVHVGGLFDVSLCRVIYF